MPLKPQLWATNANIYRLTIKLSSTSNLFISKQINTAVLTKVVPQKHKRVHDNVN